MTVILKGRGNIFRFCKETALFYYTGRNSNRIINNNNAFETLSHKRGAISNQFLLCVRWYVCQNQKRRREIIFTRKTIQVMVGVLA